MLPITDTELIVYFFNSTSRPIVAIRLYARGWGPAEITRVLNDHRDIRPDGYQRNTCSVKLTTAIRRGREIWGADWEPQCRDFFTKADDAEATDAIIITGEELESAQDCSVHDLLQSLIKFPTTDTGIFTKCVKWCAENDRKVEVGSIHRVGIALDRGWKPEYVLAQPSPLDLVKMDLAFRNSGHANGETGHPDENLKMEEE